MAQFLTQAWVDEFNDAVGHTELYDPQPVASLLAEDGHLGVLQQIRGVPQEGQPDGQVALLLRIDDRVARLSLVDSAPADVTVSLDYAAAAAMSQGELDPAAALGEGRIQVRGDLSVLVASHSLLRQAADRLAPLASQTTY